MAAPASDAAEIAAIAVDAAVEPEAGNTTPGQAALAEKLNIEAKDAIYGEHYDLAVQKLREAVALMPHPKYFINLCVALVQLGRLDEALTACDAVNLNNPTSEHRRKAAQLIAKIRAEAKKQHLELHAGASRAEEKRGPPVPASPKPASSMSQAEIAARLNEEGKELLYKDQYEAAVTKLQEAAARVPEAKYFLNLCVAQFQAGRLSEALTSCMAVDLNHPNDDQRSKATKLIERLKAEAKKQGIELR
jgi:Flp pilus assembly protein TadD